MKRKTMRARVAAAAFALTAIGLGAAARGEEPPVAVSARLADDGETARLGFDLSGPVKASARALADPDRIVVDLPEVHFQIDPAVGHVGKHEGALVKAYRFGLFGPGKSRVVIELAHPACVAKIETKAIAAGAAPSRLAVELRACPAAEFAEAAKAAAAEPTPAVAEPAPTASAPGLPVIVIDPGHGGVDGGAFGVHGVVEKNIVYDFSLALKRKLEADGHFKVIMTRDGDQYVSLEDRVKIARDADAALFISIHADTLGASLEVAGTTVYTCSERASDGFAARIAERENAADKAAGAEKKDADPDVADILFDLRRRESRAYAHLFSRGLVSQWQGVGRLNHNPERSAGFVVLKAPDFPSVLVELGYLSNTEDVANLTNPDWRDKATNAMVAAVTRFFAAPAAAAPAVAASGGKAAETK